MKNKLIPTILMGLASVFADNADAQIAIPSGVIAKDTAVITRIYKDRESGYYAFVTNKNDTLSIDRGKDGTHPRFSVTTDNTDPYHKKGTLIVETDETVFITDRLFGAQAYLLRQKFPDNRVNMKRARKQSFGARFF